MADRWAVMIRPVAACVLIAAVAGGGCEAAFLNQTASLGGGTAGTRGSIRVLVMNNTNEQAVFTLGTYNQADLDSVPSIEQFGPSDVNPVRLGLAAGASSDILTVPCDRVFGIGSPRLLELVEGNPPAGTIVPEALLEGVAFSTVSTDDELSSVPVGTALPFEALLGVDFECGALLILRFENDTEPGGFRIDFEWMPSESTR